MSSNQQNESAGNRLFGLVIVGGVLYFTWQAEPLISYFNRPAFIDALWRNTDGLTVAMAFLVDASDIALLVLTTAAPVGIFLGSSVGGSAFSGLCFLALGPLGWYAGRKFAFAHGRYSTCMDNSFFGFSCSLDGPVLLFLLLSFLLLLCAVATVLDIVAGIAERMKGTGET